MKRCNGCKYLVHGLGHDLCRAGEEYLQFGDVKNPYTGRVENRWDFRSLHGNSLRQTVIERRSAHGFCGPEAKLWEAGLWHRIKTAVKCSFSARFYRV